MPLSISIGLTKIDLLKFAAFAALFFLIWRYPFEEPFEDFGFRNSDFGFFILSPEQSFLRSVIFAVLGTGLLVAALGFVERFSWNGKILLFAAGYDAGEPMAGGIPRASGPFINPDHFANYLSLIFPLALGCALFRTFIVSREQQSGFKIFCAFTAFLLFTGILLSLSRGGWISALLGVVILAWLAPWGVAAGRRSAGSRERGASSREHGARSRRARGHRAGSSGHRSSGRQYETGDGRLETGRSGNSKFEIRNSKFSRSARVARLSAITICILLIVSLFFAGPSGREEVDARLSETVEQHDLGLGARISVILKDTPAMIRDFPLFGVGLGAWPELFLQYKSGPWSLAFFREAHNDYLEVLAETGVIGFGLLAMFFVVAGKRIVQGVKKSSSKYLPLMAGILAALGGMALHEWLDFSLQIPANAFLFTVLLALGMRLAGSMEQEAGSTEQNATNAEPNTQHPTPDTRRAWSAVARLRSPVAAVSICLLALIALVCSLRQDQTSYPYNLREMTSLAEAKELLTAHPTHAPYHLALLRLAGADAPLPWQLDQAKAALWNEPANPYHRDFYAATLMAMEKTDEGLKEITRSVAESPSLNTHVYLSPENLPLLLAEEQDAVEEGFRQALARSYPEAMTGLGEFYAGLNRFADQAALYEHAAGKETDSAKKTDLLLKAGLGYLRAGSREQGAGELGMGDGRRTTEAGLRSSVSGHSGPPNATNAMTAGSREQGARSGGPASKEQSAAVSARPMTGDRRPGDPAIRNPKSEIRNSQPNTQHPTPTLPAPSSMLHAAAERLFREAITVTPTDGKAFHHLLMAVFAVRKDWDGARELVANGIKSGAPALSLYLAFAEAAHKGGSPEETEAALELAKTEVEKSIRNGQSPYTLYMSLAEGARRAGNREQEAAALLKALDRQPRSPDTLGRLANVYFQKRNFDRAALYLNRISQINPDSADVYYSLAVAEEARYRFADAGRAYSRALELAPQNASYRERYEAFKARVDGNRVTGDGRLETGLASTRDGRQATGDREP